MYKVDTKDLEEITKFLDKLPYISSLQASIKNNLKAKQLSKMIKDKYTEIKPDYEL